MELKNTEKLEKSQVKLTVAVSAEELEAAKETAYKKNKNKISVPGFRKGKAPRKMIEKLYGEGVFLEDAINECFPSAFDFAMEQSGTKPIAQGNVDLGEITGAGFEFIITVPVEPEVAVSEYKGLEAAKETPVVTEEDIQQQMNVYIQRATTTETVDRAAENGDTAVIDFEGFVDGVAFEGGKGEKHPLKLGSGQFIPGFEDQIVGHNVGDAFDVTVTFPEDYHADELKGKEAVFHCKLNGLEYNELPVLDDDFAKDVSEFDTLDEYKADIRAKLNEKHKKEADNAVEEQLIKALCDKLVCDIPECMFENETENFVRDYDNRLRMQGLDLSTYFKYTGMDLDTLRKNMRPDAERQVKTRLALEKIAALENLEATEEEIEAEYTRLAEAYNMEADKIKEAVAADAIAEDLKVKKAIDLVKEKAVVTAKAPEAADAE